MKKTLLLSLICASASVLVQPLLAQETMATAARIDQSLFTTYSLDSAKTSVSYLTCGSTQNTSGCYGSGTFGTYGKVGGILEGNPKTNQTTGTVTRAVYILDIASGTNKTGVTLYLYTKTDVVTDDFDTVSVSLTNTITLPLTGGLTATASMAANNQFVFVGTNQSPQGVEMSKRTLQPVLVGGFSPPINVSAITVDQYGYAAMTFGTFGNGSNGFYLFGPDGTLQEDGGGAQFTVGTTQAVLPANLQ